MQERCYVGRREVVSAQRLVKRYGFAGGPARQVAARGAREPRAYVVADGAEVPLAAEQSLEWGRAGRGCVRPAEAILTELCGAMPPPVVGAQFASDVVAWLPRERFELGEGEVRWWLRLRGIMAVRGSGHTAGLCGVCHWCGVEIRLVGPEGEWCDRCGVYQRPRSHGFGEGEFGECPRPLAA